jgi:MbtH protein
MNNDCQYQVVVDSEEQYSIWLGDAPPQAWRGVGFQPTWEHCLEHIQEIWTDMRPLSLWRAMHFAGMFGNNRG